VEGLTPSSTEALVRLDALPGGDWERVLEEALRVASNVLDVETTSYWRFRAEPPSIVCELGVNTSAHRLERGFVIGEVECPVYFREIQRSQVFAVDDAASDERVRELGTYIETRRIGAFLDTAVRVGEQAVGVLCHEHVGTARRWTDAEKQFAFALGQILAGRLHARARSQAEQGERRSILLADTMADVASCSSGEAAAALAVERSLRVLGDMAILVVFGDDGEPRYQARTHVDPDKRPLMDEIGRLYPPRMEGPGLASQAIRERQSVLVPTVSREAARWYNIGEDELASLSQLRIRSAMAVPFIVRKELRGAMVFANCSHSYDQDDLRFAELYAQRIGLILDNLRLYQRSQDAVRARDEFLSLASHELRTPLTTLCLSARNLQRDADKMDPAALKKMGERMVRQTDRLDRLTERLLNAAEVGQGRPSINLEVVDLNEIADDVSESFRSIATAAGSPLEVHSDGHVVGRYDPVRLHQVLGNLLDNAIKFGNGKPVEVDVRARDGQAVISIRDHGPGIPVTDIPGLFSRFGRGSSAKGIGGLGLGLHVVQQIVEAHGGRVRLEPTPGGGSTFTVVLPIDKSGL
jgi:signal transduction histidine kinase